MNTTGAPATPTPEATAAQPAPVRPSRANQRFTTERQHFDVANPNILNELFQIDHLRRTIRRMRAWQESENEVTHPLRRIILREYEIPLAQSISASVRAGNWTPNASYITLVAKRTGTYRELVFPGIIDTIVGRRIIDALEPHITKDDNNRVFFGRSNANVDRARGDYENWFQVWLDFSASITNALHENGYTYVFDTDITQFFPSVDRERAKHALAQRTHAHQTLLELLFYCIEAWAPRVRYCAIPGLPIEPNDVSRLIAHNYIKGVDEHFVNDTAIHYLRWVDDTVIFVTDERAALDIKRRHHLALREMGLSPNASKTSIMTAAAFGATRHPEINQRINDITAAKDTDALAQLVTEWYARDHDATPNWDKVTTRLYTTARHLGADCLRTHAVTDITDFPRLQRSAFRYLHDFPLPPDDLTALLNLYADTTAGAETCTEIARFLADAVITTDTTPLLDRIIVELCGPPRLGMGYANALLLLCLHKHGSRDHRDTVRKHLTLDRLQDDQLRLHYLYVYTCRNELDDAIARATRHQDTPDIALLMRLLHDTRDGRLHDHERSFKTCFPKTKTPRTVKARYLPFLHLLLRAPGHDAQNARFLNEATSAVTLASINDPAITRFLTEERVLATR